MVRIIPNTKWTKCRMYTVKRDGICTDRWVSKGQAGPLACRHRNLFRTFCEAVMCAVI